MNNNIRTVQSESSTFVSLLFDQGFPRKQPTTAPSSRSERHLTVFCIDPIVVYFVIKGTIRVRAVGTYEDMRTGRHHILVNPLTLILIKGWGADCAHHIFWSPAKILIFQRPDNAIHSMHSAVVEWVEITICKTFGPSLFVRS
jgi:hypothetical protein